MTKSDDNAAGTGEATWFRAYARDGKVVFDGSVGAMGSDADLKLSTTTIRAGAQVALARFIYRVHGVKPP
jgi:hypothetical protein